VSRNSGEEVKEAVVTGYEPNVPLEGRNEWTLERAGEGREEGEGDRGTVLWFWTAMLVLETRSVVHYI